MDLDYIEDDDFQTAEPAEEPEKAQQTTQLRPTLLTAVSELLATFDEKYPSLPAAPFLHPFSPTPPDTDVLESISHIVGVISNCLAGHVSSQDSRYVTRTQEYTTHADSWLQSRMKASALIRRLPPKDHGYGADVPLEPALVPEWLISGIMDLLKNAGGTDVFKDSEADGRTTLICGGKILVIDIVMGYEETSPGILHLMSLKTTHASSGETHPSTLNTRRPPLDQLLFSSLKAYVDDAQKPAPDCLHIRRLGDTFQSHVESLMTFDVLADGETKAGKANGDRWFKEAEVADTLAGELAKREAKVVSDELNLPEAPLDVFLIRGHGVPLPYAFSPSLSILVYLTPAAYLEMLRTPKMAADSPFMGVDIPATTLLSHLKASLSSKRPRFVVVHLTLHSTADSPSSANHLLTLPSPSFPLISAPQPDLSSLLSSSNVDALMTEPPATHGIPDEHLNHLFPVTDPPSEGGDIVPARTRGYVLDFGHTVMRREAMSQLAGGTHPMDLSMDVDGEIHGMVGDFRSLSWVDLLVNSETKTHAQRYSSQYTPAKFTHPTLQYLLTTPQEQGYVLGKVRVNRMSEVWRMIEIVKEQAWLNDVLGSFAWTVDTGALKEAAMDIGTPSENQDDVFGESTEEHQLEALLQGSYTPKSIPVQISVKGASPNPSIHLAMPMPRPSLPLLTITVTHDPTSPKGIRVDIKADNPKAAEEASAWRTSMEEVVRRGGASILAGWIWRKAQASSSSY